MQHPGVTTYVEEYAISVRTVGRNVSGCKFAHLPCHTDSNSVVDGHQLERGDYKITLDNNTATLKKGKQVIQVPAKEETATTKYVNTAVEYTGNTIQKINFGGKYTSIVFGGGNANDGGSATVRGSGVIN